MFEMRTISALFTLLLFVFVQPNLISQTAVQQEIVPEIQWLSLEQAIEKNNIEPRKIMIDFYTDWCQWCERMDKTTLKHPAIIQFINENFYPVKFNAEQQEIILFKEKKYAITTAGKRTYHELAIEMLQGRMSFPSIVFLDESTNIIQGLVGFKTPDQLMQIVKYFAENHYKDTPWTSYCKRFQAKGVFVDED